MRDMRVDSWEGGKQTAALLNSTGGTVLGGQGTTGGLRSPHAGVLATFGWGQGRGRRSSVAS